MPPKPRKRVSEPADASTSSSEPPIAKKKARLTAANSTILEDSVGWLDLSVALISEKLGCDRRVADGLTKLFAEDNTVPFICRYRKHVTGDLEVEKIREAERCVETAKAVKDKCQKVLKQIPNEELTPQIQQSVLNATSLGELESLSAAYKETKSTLAAKAKAANLGPASEDILAGKVKAFDPRFADFLSSFVDTKTAGRKTPTEVRQGIIHILADSISKNPDVQREIRARLIARLHGVKIECHKSKSAKMSDEDKQEFGHYFDFNTYVDRIKSHQVLAWNRGEDRKALSVKVVLPDRFKQQFFDIAASTVLFKAVPREYHSIPPYKIDQRLRILDEFNTAVMQDCWDRLVEKQIQRAVRAQLTTDAESDSFDCFGRNLQHLLLQPPLRSVCILGVDPGFKHGCKCALIGPSGNILLTGIFNLAHVGGSGPNRGGSFGSNRSQNVLSTDGFMCDCKNLCLSNDINTCKIAIGNGTGCRETEKYISDLITAGFFEPIATEYTIVNECGASIYSVSDTAIKEMPDLEENIRSAVSIARRLQDPLSELVKIEPQHLGVGMYQHDLNKKQLSKRLDAVVEECVSFVGVDVNTASVHLLQRISGLNRTLAERIVTQRTATPIINREQLKKIKGIGAKTFEQCAGFVRVDGKTVNSGSAKKSKVKLEPLDSTVIHPESYEKAKSLIKKCGCTVDDIGSSKLRQALDSILSTLSQDTEMTEIVKALKQDAQADIRNDYDRPQFKRAIRSMDDLTSGMELTGQVTNVTSFGAFVDCGVHRDGLVHVSQIPRHLRLDQHFAVGKRCVVQVITVDGQSKKISLRFIRFDG